MKKLLVISLMLVALGLAATPAVAMPTFISPISPPVDIPVNTGGIDDWLVSVGVGGLVLLAVEILKQLNVLPDGKAGIAASVTNVVLFAALTVGGVFGFDITDSSAQNVIEILEQVGNLALMVVTSPLVFRFLREAGVLPHLKSRTIQSGFAKVK